MVLTKGPCFRHISRPERKPQSQLRKKIGDAGSSPLHLVTVHGVGYKLER